MVGRKDRITRGAIAGLVRQRWPAQEALEKALADTNTDWTVIRGLEVKGIHTAMEQADQGLELGKGAGRGKGVFRDQKWCSRFPAILDRNKEPAPLPSSNTTKKPGTIKSSRRPRTATLRRGRDALGIRHLSHPQARNFVVLSIPLNVVLTNGIAHRKRCTVATSSHRRMAVSVSRQTMEHINTVRRKLAPTVLWSGGGQKRFSRTALWSSKLDYSSIVQNILRGLGEVICCKSLGARDSMDWLLSSTCGLASIVLCMPYWR